MPGILSSHALVAPQGRGSTLGVGRHEPHHSLFHEVPSRGGEKQPPTGNVTERDGTGSPPPPANANSAEERSAMNSNQTLRLGPSGGLRRPRCRGADVGGTSPPQGEGEPTPPAPGCPGPRRPRCMVAEVGDLSKEGDPTLASVTADDLFLARFGFSSESIEKPVLETRPATSPHGQEAGQVSEEVWEYSSEATPECRRPRCWRLWRLAFGKCFIFSC